jgi:hypothetical protein
VILLFCLLILSPAPESTWNPAQFLERAREILDQIEKARGEGRETKALYGNLLDACVQLRRVNPASVPLCINEGHAASLAGDWPHALLAYRLAQRLDPANAAVASRLTAVRGRLVLPDEPASPWDELSAVLATNTRLRASLWLLALLLYAMAWVRLASFAPRRMGSGIGLALWGIGAAAAIVAAIFWADEYRLQKASQTLVVIRRGDPVVLREGNGLSYPVTTADRLRTGTELSLLTRRGDWLQVRTGSGLVGWIPSGAAEVE